MLVAADVNGHATHPGHMVVMSLMAIRYLAEGLRPRGISADCVLRNGPKGTGDFTGKM